MYNFRGGYKQQINQERYQDSQKRNEWSNNGHLYKCWYVIKKHIYITKTVLKVKQTLIWMLGIKELRLAD